MRKPNPTPAPLTIPTLVLDVHPDGTLTATVDGTPLVPPEGAGPWSRSSFGQIIDQATSDRTIPARVEVHENDGSTFTDIIPPRRRTTRPTPKPEPERPAPASPVLYEVSGSGFVPGEDVAVAVITGHTAAAGTGTARTLIDPTHLDIDITGGVVEVLLFGHISGTTVIERMP